MAEVLLTDWEQAAVRQIIAAEPVPGGPLPGEVILRHIGRLFRCDAVGVVLYDATGLTVLGRAATGSAPHGAEPKGPPALGVHLLERAAERVGSRSGPRAAVLSLSVRQGHHIVQLWLVRRRAPFAERDRAVLVLVAPAIERHLREPPAFRGPRSLTLQERRVLLHVAEGLSNGEIAERLVVASSTVRKHLEHAYRKLGVTNRLAAVRVLQAGEGAWLGMRAVGTLGAAVPDPGGGRAAARPPIG
jgi:DNA-binding CsgD family transcriptional regulator